MPPKTKTKTKPKRKSTHGGARAGAGRPPGEPTKPYYLRLPVAVGLAQEAEAVRERIEWHEWAKRALDLSMALAAVARGEIKAVPAHLWPCGRDSTPG